MRKKNWLIVLAAVIAGGLAGYFTVKVTGIRSWQYGRSREKCKHIRGLSGFHICGGVFGQRRGICKGRQEKRAASGALFPV